MLFIPKMWGKKIHTFPMGISLKVIVIVWLVFKLVYKAEVQHFHHSAIGTPFTKIEDIFNFYKKTHYYNDEHQCIDTNVPMR